MKYFIDKDAMPPICVPSDLDLTKCIEVTVMGDTWRRYLDGTGKLHDGKKYFKQMQEEFFSHPEAKTDHWY